MPERPIFEQLVALELRLAALFTGANAFRRSRKRIGYQTVLREWYGRGDGRGLRGEVVHLVGSLRKKLCQNLKNPEKTGQRAPG